MGRTTNDRIITILLMGLGLFSILWLRCVWLQWVGAPRYRTIAASQHYATEVQQARRGGIYDRAGRPLAVSVLAPSVFANARRVSAKDDVAQRLSEAIGKDADVIRRRLEKDKGFVWIARHVDPDVTPALEPLREAGVGIREEPTRLYPHHQLASHILGFVNIDQRGLEGLELAYDAALRGQEGWRATLRDAKGNLLLGPWTSAAKPVDGRDLVLTIDAVVQQVAEDTLAWGVTKYHAKGGSIIVMEPFTGAVLAMANAPSFAPTNPGVASPDRRRNRAVTDLFEPGSTFKIVAAAALLEEGRITPEEAIFCENGAWPTVARHTLHDHKPHATLSFHDVIRLSSNIGTAKAAQRLTPAELHRYIAAFGFGQKTGIDVPGEVSGIVPPISRWSKLSPYIIPIGQEVAVTPMQLAVMTAIVANGGLRVRPYLVDRIQTPDGRWVRSMPTPSSTRVISPQTAMVLQSMLVSVIESGTGQLARLQSLTAAGKTGTAQKLEPTGRYSHSRFVASFVGFGPVPDSRFVVVVSVDEPRPLYFGGVVAAPMFKRMVERLSGYWELKRVPSMIHEPT